MAWYDVYSKTGSFLGNATSKREAGKIGKVYGLGMKSLRILPGRPPMG